MSLWYSQYFIHSIILRINLYILTNMIHSLFKVASKIGLLHPVVGKVMVHHLLNIRCKVDCLWWQQGLPHKTIYTLRLVVTFGIIKLSLSGSWSCKGLYFFVACIIVFHITFFYIVNVFKVHCTSFSSWMSVGAKFPFTFLTIHAFFWQFMQKTSMFLKGTFLAVLQVMTKFGNFLGM